MIVSKFGGTSVATYEAMQRSARIVASNPERRLIVISAISGTTNNLIELANGRLDSTEREELLEEIEQQHLAILGQCEEEEMLTDNFYRVFSELREHLDYVGRDKRWKDALFAFGELMSTHIFVGVLREHGVNAEWLDARKVIKTDSTFGKGEPVLDSIKKKAAIHIQAGKTYLTQGFIGCDIFGNTTTLGRGGSDLSAALFAEAVGASALEIWTDVAGVYSTDPRIVPTASPIHEISFDEAAELAVFGGKVLHPATLKPAVRNDIKVRVASSANPDDTGTYIVKKSNESPVVRAISLRRDQSLLTISSLKMMHKHGFLAKLFNVLANHKISVDLVSTSEVSVALTLDTAVNAAHKVELTDEVLEELKAFAEVEVEHDLALIALIGNDIQKTSGVGDSLFSPLKSYNVRLICHGASANNLCFLVKQNEAEEIIKLLHEKFISA